MDDTFTYEIGQVRYFQNENIPKYRLVKPVLLFSDNQRHVFKEYFYNHFSKKIITCVFMCRNITIPFIRTIPLTPGLKTIERRLEIYVDFTVSL